MTNAVSPSVVSMTVQVFSVVLTSISKNWLTNQKPESLTCDNTVAPAAIAITIAVSCRLFKAASAAAALSRPAVVVRATVAEPCATRSTVATRNAYRISDIPRSDSESLSASPMPLNRSTPPNMPPAPVMRMIEQMGVRRHQRMHGGEGARGRKRIQQKGSAEPPRDRHDDRQEYHQTGTPGALTLSAFVFGAQRSSGSVGCASVAVT